MTHEEFITIVRNPESVVTNHVHELKELIDLHPYFAAARLFYVKALKQSNSIQFASNLKVASLYCSNRRWLYYLLYPEKLIVSEPYRRDKLTKSKSAGDYFDMMNNVESEAGDTKQSLKNLAQRLKLARSIITPLPVSRPANPISEIPAVEVVPFNFLENKMEMPRNRSEVSEDTAKKLISERKYAEAIEILRDLNLNNPKKSVYFADQIRFLEKIIANSKK
jgi:hypothetical protein